jgi:trehalose 6-phosphate synthase complex regulatory subunit
LRIITGANSFLVLPNNISRSTAVGAILHPGGPLQSPRSGLASTSSGMVNGGGGAWNEEEGMNERHHHGAGVEANGDETRGVFAVSGDEKLLRFSGRASQ